MIQNAESEPLAHRPGDIADGLQPLADIPLSFAAWVCGAENPAPHTHGRSAYFSLSRYTFPLPSASLLKITSVSLMNAACGCTDSSAELLRCLNIFTVSTLFVPGLM